MRLENSLIAEKWAENLTDDWIIAEYLTNSEVREWRHDSDKTQTNKLEWQMILKQKPVFLKHLWNKNFAYIPCISLSTRLCWLRLAGNSVICILFLDFVRFAIAEIPEASK